MKFTFIDSERNEVVVYGKEKTTLIKSIENLCQNDETIDAKNIYGYLEDDIVTLHPENISLITIEDEKTIAVIDDKKYQLKYPLYRLIEILGNDFIQINKSSIINMKKIKRFNNSWKGNLLVELQNGYSDYIARRRIKEIKERMGL